MVWTLKNSIYSQLYYDESNQKHITWLLPSSFVLLNTTALFGPSPAEVKANTWNSYAVYFASPVTSLVWLPPSNMIKFKDDPIESFFLYNSLNPVMFPCLAYFGGNCQDVVILVDVVTATLKSQGAW